MLVPSFLRSFVPSFLRSFVPKLACIAALGLPVSTAAALCDSDPTYGDNVNNPGMSAETNLRIVSGGRIAISGGAISWHDPGSEEPIAVYKRNPCDLPSDPVASLHSVIDYTEASHSHDLLTGYTEYFKLIHDSQAVQAKGGQGPLHYTGPRGIWNTATDSFGIGALEWGSYCGPDLVAEEPSADNMDDSQQWVFSRGGNIFYCPTTPCLASDEVKITDDPLYWDYEPRLFDQSVVFTRRGGPGLMETAVVMVADALNPGPEIWIATNARRPDIYGDWVAYEQWRPDPPACSYLDGETYHTQIHVFGPLSDNPTTYQAFEGGGHPDDPDYLGKMTFERPRLTSSQLLFLRIPRDPSESPMLYTYPVLPLSYWKDNQGTRHVEHAIRDQIFDAWDEAGTTAVAYIFPGQHLPDLRYHCFVYW